MNHYNYRKDARINPLSLAEMLQRVAGCHNLSILKTVTRLLANWVQKIAGKQPNISFILLGTRLAFLMPVFTPGAFPS